MEDYGSYCISECKAACCRRGKILITAQERERFLADGRKHKKHTIIERPDGQFEMHLDPCKCLDGYRCTIYADRPNICREFPIFERGKSVFLSLDCPLVRAGKFDDAFPGKRLIKW